MNTKKRSLSARKMVISASVIVSAFVLVGGLSAGLLLKNNSTDERGQAFSVTCSPDKLRHAQIIVRGNQFWRREAPVNRTDVIWSQVGPWSKILDLNQNPTALPGTGEVDAYSEVIGNTGLVLTMFRGGQKHRRVVPAISGSWVTQVGYYEWWNTPGDWTSTAYDTNKYPYAYAELFEHSWFLFGAWFKPTTSTTQLGRVSEQKFSPSLEKWETILDSSIESSALPGSGQVKTFDMLLSNDGTKLTQSWVRGNTGYMRTVPVDVANKKVLWAQAGPISEIPNIIAALPGSGELQAQSSHNYCLP